MSDPDHDSDLLWWARRYVTAGFEVFPVSHLDKSPLTDNGFKDATSDLTTVTAWWTRNPHALIGCRIPADVIVLDIDPRHGGDATWRQLQDEHDVMPTTRRHASGRGDGGHHIWMLRPEGKITIRNIDTYAREHGTGHAIGKSRWTGGIDLLHHNYRYTILPPSPHPETRLPYVWLDKRKPVPAPAWLAALLTATPRPQPTPPPTRTLRIADDTSIADWFSATSTWNDILQPLGWVLVSGNGDEDGSKWRHPNATAKNSCSIRHGCLFVYTPNTEFEPTEEGSANGYTRFKAWATVEHGGDMSAAAKAAMAIRGPAAPRHPTPPPNVDPATGEVIDDGPRTPLGDDFWQARPHLAHIRTAALSRMVAPAAVLGCILARVAAFTPPSTCLPPIVGSASPLNFMAALYARSGGGKSSAVGCAEDLLPDVPPGCVGPLGLGSGEGLIDAYFELVEETDGGGKKQKVKRQTRRGALFILDEGQALAEMGNRKGSTILPILRTAWSGADAGQANASIETRRTLRKMTYALGLVSLWQDQAAARLLEDVDGGTPQRFTWLSTNDPSIDVDCPEWPGPLDWRPPDGIAIDGRHRPHPMHLHPDIVAEVRHHHATSQRGEVDVAPLDSHRRLLKLKIAGLLAVLDGRHDIGLDDWQLAETIMTHSDGVRAWIVSEAARRRRDAEVAGAYKQVAKDEILERSAASRSLARAARAVYRVASQHPAVNRRQAMQAINSRDRQQVTVDEAIAEAERLRWVVRKAENEWSVGDAKPA